MNHAVQRYYYKYMYIYYKYEGSYVWWGVVARYTYSHDNGEFN